LRKEFKFVEELNSMACQSATERAWIAIERFYSNCQSQKPGKKGGVAELRYDLCGQGMFWLPDLPRLKASEIIGWIGNRNIPKLKIMNY
jgi:hypothetical protein